MKYRIQKYGNADSFIVQYYKEFKWFSFFNGWYNHDTEGWPEGRYVYKYNSIEKAQKEIEKLENNKKNMAIGWNTVYEK